jgi:hypothetical protein
MITITEKIFKLIEPYDGFKQKEILSMAWDICCDGAALSDLEIILDYDPWDGEHEEKRKEIEYHVVECVIDAEF